MWETKPRRRYTGNKVIRLYAELGEGLTRESAGISSRLCIVVVSCIKDDIYRLWLYTSMDRTRHSVDLGLDTPQRSNQRLYTSLYIVLFAIDSKVYECSLCLCALYFLTPCSQPVQAVHTLWSSQSSPHRSPLIVKNEYSNLFRHFVVRTYLTGLFVWKGFS